MKKPAWAFELKDYSTDEIFRHLRAPFTKDENFDFSRFVKFFEKLEQREKAVREFYNKFLVYKGNRLNSHLQQLLKQAYKAGLSEDLCAWYDDYFSKRPNDILKDLEMFERVLNSEHGYFESACFCTILMGKRKKLNLSKNLNAKYSLRVAEYSLYKAHGPCFVFIDNIIEVVDINEGVHRYAPLLMSNPSVVLFSHDKSVLLKAMRYEVENFEKQNRA